MINEKDLLLILRNIYKHPTLSQRKIATILGYSIGKLNYSIKKLQKKGLIKIKNFKKNPNKLNYLYIITPRGIAEKTRMTIKYMKKISQEYNELKKELDIKK